MVAIAGLKPEFIFRAVTDMYTAVAREPGREFHFPTGRAACLAVGYPEEELRVLPSSALESFAGVGYPFKADAIRAGDTVLDIGSGSGTDALIASRCVGPAGKVYALDMTPAMREKLTATIERAGVMNIAVLAGNAEAIPLADASVDAVTSNGVLNLVPDKSRAFAEIFRVLKPGGRLQIADIALRKPIAPKYKQDPKMWAECVVGAIAEDDYLERLRAAGFDVEAVGHLDYFSLSRSEETRTVANLFGAHAVVLNATKSARVPADIPRHDPWRRLASESAGVAGAGLAFAICSGFPALLSALAAIGASALAQHAYMFPVFVACLGVSVWFLHSTARAHDRLAPFWIAAAFSVSAIAAFWLSVTGFVPAAWWWPYVGLAGIVAASLWSFFANRAAPNCIEDMLREAAKPDVPAGRRLARSAAWIAAAAAIFYGLYKSVEVFTVNTEQTVRPAPSGVTPQRNIDNSTT